MRAASWLILVAFGIPAVAFGQATSSDSQTLQALLTEVRELRQDLLSSLARVERAQILLALVQTQQANVVRASEGLNDARAKLADAEDRQKHIAIGLKQVEDELSGEANPAQQKALQDRINHFKPELEESTGVLQRCQAGEIEAEQQLRAEQDKLAALQTRLDELVRSVGTGGQSSPAPR